MSLLDELRSRREEILALASQHGASNLRIFGSVARHEETPESDLDVLVEMAQGRSYFDLFGFQADFASLINRDVQVTTDRALYWTMRDLILREAISL